MLRRILLVCTVVGGCAFVSSANGQDRNSALRGVEAEDAAQKAAIAESIVAREEAATGRAFDPAYRAAVGSRLASQPLAGLEAQKDRSGLAPFLLGDSAADLVLVPVAPCRIIDTRVAGGQITAGAQRNFYVAGTAGFPGQGGTTGGCGIPLGPATAVVINFVAVNPAGAGDLRAFPFGGALPTASIVNYALPGSGLNIANGLDTKICDPATTTCTFDLVIQADSSAVHVVADVQGYFRKTDLVAAVPVGYSQLAATTLVAGLQYIISPTTVSLPHAGSCLVTCEVDTEQPVTTGALFFKTAQRNVGTATNFSDPGWGNDAVYPSQRTSASKTHVWPMAAGTIYQFGCSINAVTDFVGTVNYPTVAWICR
jgi:hypothetical protein